MIDKAQNTEQLAEALLEAYAKELCASQDAYLDELANAADEKTDCPPFFVPQPQTSKPPRRKGGRRRTAKRALLLVAVLVLIQGLIVVSEGSKENTFNYYQEEQDGKTILTYLGLGSGEELPAFALGWIPEGYSVIDETVSDTAREISYRNDAGEYLYFTVQQSEAYNANLDDEGMEKKAVSIRGYSGYLFYGGGKCVLMWQVGEYTLDLSGWLTKEEAVRMAEGVVLKK